MIFDLRSWDGSIYNPRVTEPTNLTQSRIARQKIQALECFTAGHTISSTATEIGITRETLYDWRSKDAQFGKAWDEAYARRLDHIEDIAFDRAASGSDNLIMFLLRGGRSERYGDKRQLDVTSHTSVDVRLLRALPVDELLERLHALRDAQRGLEIEGNVIDLPAEEVTRKSIAEKPTI